MSGNPFLNELKQREKLTFSSTLKEINDVLILEVGQVFQLTSINRITGEIEITRLTPRPKKEVS